MAHEISHASGRAEIAYTGATPWHGLGVKVEGLQTAAAMLTHAGLDWSVGLQPMRLDNGDAVKGYRAIVRQDVGTVLGVASDRYHVIQNAQAGEIVDALVTEGGAQVEVAGALGQGERCWMLAHIPADFEVVKGDLVQPYFLLAWGHDGKHGVAGKLTPIRVVCNNTLTAAGFGGRGVKWSASADVYLRHSAKAALNIAEAQKALGLARKQAEETADAYRAFGATALTDAEAAAYFAAVFQAPATPEAESDEYRARLAKWTAHQETVARLYQTGAGAELARGTVWGAYNATTEWVDHVYPMLQSGAVSKIRQQSVMFGAYADVKRRAFEQAVALVG